MKRFGTFIDMLGMNRLFALAAILMLCAIATTDAQVFSWAKDGGGEGWRHVNDVAVDAAGNALMVCKFTGSGSSSANAIIFDKGYDAIGSTDAMIVMYDQSGAFRWPCHISGAGATVTANAIAVYGDFLYVAGDIIDPNETVTFGSNSLDVVPPGSSYIAKFSYDGSSCTASWVKVISATSGTTPSAVKVTDICVDNDGNALLCGSITGTADFGGTPLSSDPGATCMFVAKYDIDGTGPTVSASTGNGITQATGIAYDGVHDYAVVVGNSDGNIMLENTSLNFTSSEGGMFLVQWDPTNSTGPLFGMSTPTVSGSNHSVIGNGIAVDNIGNIYAVGRFTGMIPTSTNTISSDLDDFFLVKWSSSLGLPIWGRQGNMNLSSEAFANGVAVTSDGTGIFVTGGFSGTMDLTGGNENITLGSMGNHDIFIASYDQGGNLQRARRAGNSSPMEDGPHYNQGIAIAVDGSGNPHVVGEYGAAPMSPAELFGTGDLTYHHHRNIFTAKLTWNDAVITGMVSHSSIGVEGIVLEIAEGTPSSSNPVDYVVTGPSGEYTLYLRHMNTYYVVSPLVDNSSYWTLDPLYREYQSPISMQDQNYNVVSVPSSPPSIPDLRVTATKLSTDYAVPNGIVRYRIAYRNVGTGPTTPGLNIVLDFDPRLNPTTSQPSSSSHAGPTINGTQMTWTRSTPLLPFGHGEVVGVFRVSDAVRPGDSNLFSTVTVSDSNGQFGPTLSLKDEVLDPLDPNRKMVEPTDKLASTTVKNGQQILTYVIEFQNTGQAEVNHIQIRDVLDPRLDVSLPGNLKILSVGPGSYISMIPPPGKMLVVDIRGAHLQPVQFGGGTGFVRFSVPVDPSVPIGTIVPNRACITFYDSLDVSLGELCTNTTNNCVAPDFMADSVCLGDSTRFTTRNVSIGRDFLNDSLKAAFLQWDFGDSSRSNLLNPVHLYTSPGTYFVSLKFTDLPGGPAHWICDEFDTSFVIRKAIRVTPRPQPIVSRDSIGRLLSTLAHSYQWFRDGNAIPGATGRLLIADSSGSYTVLAMNVGGCAEFSNTIDTTISAMSAPGMRRDDPSIRLYPNPGHDHFTIEFGRTAGPDVIVSIYDATGELVSQQLIESGRGACDIDLAGHPSGVYRARIDIDGRITIRSFVHQH